MYVYNGLTVCERYPDSRYRHQRRYSIETPTWQCPHCGFIHHAFDVLRVDFSISTT